ncbi:MAG: RNA polymerase sigma factor [Bacilli bacterium]
MTVFEQQSCGLPEPLFRLGGAAQEVEPDAALASEPKLEPEPDGALESELERYRPMLVRHALAMTGSRWEAEDIAQETCVKCLSRVREIRVHPNPEAYLLRISRNVWLDRKRRERIAAHALCDHMDMTAEEVPAALQEDMEPAVQVLIESLTPLQRTVFLLRDVLDLSASEAADLLRTSEGAVKAALHRARTALDTIRRKTRAEEIAIPDERAQRELLRAYVWALRLGHVPAIVQLAMTDSVDPAQATARVLAWTGERRDGPSAGESTPQAVLAA